MSAVSAHAEGVLQRDLRVVAVERLVLRHLQSEATELAVRKIQHRSDATRIACVVSEWRLEWQDSDSVVRAQLIVASTDPPSRFELPGTLHIPAVLRAVVNRAGCECIENA